MLELLHLQRGQSSGWVADPSPAVGVGWGWCYQVEGTLELAQHILAAGAGALQLAQGVLEGTVLQFG